MPTTTSLFTDDPLIYEGRLPEGYYKSCDSFAGSPVPSRFSEEQDRFILRPDAEYDMIMEDHSRRSREQVLQWLGPDGFAELFARIDAMNARRRSQK